MSELPGDFVVFEGIDGSGKSTIIDMLETEIEDAVITREPSDGYYGKLLRDVLQDCSSPSNTLGDFFMFMADRSHHVENVIRPALEEGKTVICDRYIGSTVAYQDIAVRKNVGISPEEYMGYIGEGWMIEPDIEIFLDIPVEQAIERLSTDEKYENYYDLSKARHIYTKRFIDKDYCHRIQSSNKNKESTFSSVLGVLQEQEIL